MRCRGSGTAKNSLVEDAAGPWGAEEKMHECEGRRLERQMKCQACHVGCCISAQAVSLHVLHKCCQCINAAMRSAASIRMLCTRTLQVAIGTCRADSMYSMYNVKSTRSLHPH